jgi:hypothetical protein
LLGVLWAGVEPVEGEYNSTYLDIVETIVNMAGALGTTQIFCKTKWTTWTPLETAIDLACVEYQTKAWQTGQLIGGNVMVEVKTEEFRTSAQIKHFCSFLPMSEANAMILSTNISVEFSLNRALNSYGTANLKTDYSHSRKIRLIEGNAKFRHLKKCICKGT